MSNVKLWQGDCLELIRSMYVNENMTMRSIAKHFGTNHKLIARRLKSLGIKTRPPKNLRGKRKFPCDIDLKYNNMATHLKWDVDYKWLRQFPDFDKLKTLNRCLTNRDNRFPFSTEDYKNFIKKFYHCVQFNRIYDKWIEKGKALYLKPSIDHIIPRSKGGDNSLENLQFLTWFENRCKNDLSQEEWDNLKLNIKDYFL